MSRNEIIEAEGTTNAEPEADTLPAPRVDAEGEDANGEVHTSQAIQVDEECFLCMGLPPAVPENSDLRQQDFHYAHGFADGVSSMIRGLGWHYCETHRKLLHRALLDRGVNWKPDPMPKRRIVLPG